MARGGVLRFGRVIGERDPGLRPIISLVNVLRHVSRRNVTMAIQSQDTGTPTARSGTGYW